MLLPKKVKFRKQFRTRDRKFRGMATKGHSLAFGSYGLKCTSAGELTSRQIEAARRAITRHIKRGGFVWIRVFPHTPVTQKAAEVPMGSGKGNVDHFALIVHPGRILFEMDGVEEAVAKEAMMLAAAKLPVKSRFVSIHNQI